MNYGMIIYLLGRVLEIVGLMMACPLVVSLYYHESNGILFLICGGIMLIAGALVCHLVKPKKTAFYAREGFVVTSLSWILLSVTGCLPFYLKPAASYKPAASAPLSHSGWNRSQA